MFRRVLKPTLLLAACLGVTDRALGQDSAAAPVVIQEARHDVSPRLQDIPPFQAPLREPFRVFHNDRAAGRAAAGRKSLVKDAVEQRTAAAIAPLSVLQSLDGIGSGVHGFTVSGSPPDPNGAVGATQYVQSVNSALAVFDKNTGALLLGPLDFRTLFTGFGGMCETRGGADPIVLYDKMAARWIVSIAVSDNVSQAFECFAVSTSSDATGSYARYAIPFGSKFNDFPKLGVWPDAYYFAGNEFDHARGGALVDRNLCAIDRAAALSGAPLRIVCFLLPIPETSGALLPTDLDGAMLPPAGAPNPFFLLGADDASLRMYKLHVDFDTPAQSALVGPIDIPVAPFNRLCPGSECVPQPNTPQRLASIGDVPNFRVAYRNFGDHESIVLNHSVLAGGNAGVRWYEIRDPSGTPTVFQQGTYVPDSSWRWMGSVAMDRAGNIALGYSLSSSTIVPSIGITGRTPDDPPGTMGAEQVAFSGLGSQLPALGRWGDYSALTVDPEDDCTFWYTSEYLPANGTFNWRTRILSFRMPGCEISSTATLQPTSLTFDGTAVGATSTARTLALINQGPGALTIGSIAATGDFAQTSDCPTSLAAGTSCAVHVTFTPTASGTRIGRVTIRSDAANTPQTAVLTGTGVAAGAGNTVVDFVGGFDASGLTLNGGASVAGTVLRLTDGGNNQARSVFFTTPVAVQSFTTDFTFRLTNAVAEGLTFTIQGDAPTRVGPAGGGLGYGGVTGGIPKSVAVKFDLANTGGEGGNSTGLYTGGVPPSVPAINLVPAGVNLHTGHVLYVHMTYDGTTLTWTITDSETGKTFSTSAAVDIPGRAGTATAFVGFTASTGGGAATAIQDILTWRFQTPGLLAPFASLVPNGLAFSSQDVGTTSVPQPVALTNHGPGTLSIESIATDGEFGQTNDCPTTLLEGQACTVQVTFTPAGAGPRRGTLTVTDNAFNRRQVISLMGTGLNTAIPIVVDFRGGFTASGLTLNGGAALNGTRLRLTDGGTGQARSAFFVPPVSLTSFVTDFSFQLTNPNADGFTFTLQRNAPTAVGTGGGGLGYAGLPTSAAVKFDLFNSAGEGNNSTGLFTNGAAPGVPAFDLTPSGINLRSRDIFHVHMNYDGAALSWTITNLGTGASFTASEAIDLPAVIGGSAAFVGFTGGTGGLTAIQDILTWTYQTPGVTGPYATLEPRRLAFGPQPIGTSSAPRPVTLTNHGPAPLHLSGITVIGDYQQTNDCGAMLAAGATCTIHVTFTPTGSGPSAGTVIVANDAAIQPQTVSLSGVGVVSGGALPVDFGGGFTNVGLTLNGGASIAGGRLRLTDGGTGQARSAFVSTAVDVRAFVTDFLFQLTNATADGFTFTIQGNAPTSVGGSGGGLGYGPPSATGTGGIPNSVAVKFDLFNGIGEGNNSTGLFTNGGFPGIPASDLTASGIDLHAGMVLRVHMTYDGTALAWTISNPATGKSFTTSAVVDIAAVVGRPTAFVGFTGGTGGLTAIQDILAWTYQTNVAAGMAVLSAEGQEFAAQVVGTTSETRVVTLTNRGFGPLAIHAVETRGDFARTHDCVTSLDVGASCAIHVTFAPTAIGTRRGTLNVTTDGFIAPPAVVLVGTGIGSSQPVIDFRAGFSGAPLALNGGATINGSLLRLTDGGTGQARSAFFDTRVNVESFTTDFSFQLTDAIADGFTFAIQGVGPTALGTSGAGLGYGGAPGGIPSSLAVKLDLFDSAGEGGNSTGLFTNGVLPTVPALDMTSSGIDLHGGRVLYVHMTYDGIRLVWTITDAVSGRSFTASADVDIPAIVGDATAFVGFTGGTGGLSAVQDIRTWTLQPGTTAPRVTLTPTALTFADQPVGTSSAAQTVTLANDGPGTFSISSLTTSLGFAQTNDCGGSLLPRTLCTILVTFTPAATGLQAGTLTVSGGRDPLTVVLSGTGVAVGTSVALISSRPASVYGEAITLTATVSPSVVGSAPPPTGTVTFTDGETLLATVTLNGGRASMTLSTLSAGPHEIVATYGGDVFHAGSRAVTAQTVSPAPLAITADDKTMVLHGSVPRLTAVYRGFVLGQGPSVLTGTLSCSTSATPRSPVGTHPINCAGQTSANYAISFMPGTLAIVYAPSGPCLGQPGHVILPPISADGTSVFRRGQDVPVRFRVCDARGRSIGTRGVVESFRRIEVIPNAVAEAEAEAASQPERRAFRFDRQRQRWFTAIETKHLRRHRTYVFRIELNDGSEIRFRFRLR